MRSVLVTGGAGFIGANFVRWVQSHVPEVRLVTLDALTYAGTEQNLRDLPDPVRHRFVEGDIGDRALVGRLLDEHDIDGIVHFAAESHVDRSILGPEAFIQTNVLGTFHLLEAARARHAAGHPVRFHHVSTDEVFGALTPDAPPFTERSRYDPSSPYSASKAGSDHLVTAYGRTYGLPVSTTHCSNNYGPFQFPEKLVPLVIANALAGRPLPIYGDGQQVRDWLYVTDHCEAIWTVATQAQPGASYVVGGDAETSNLALVHRICAVLDSRAPAGAPYAGLITHVADRPGHDRRYAIDAARLRDDLGWAPRESLETGLERTIDWYLANADWRRRVSEEKGLTAWLDVQYGDTHRGSA